LLSAPRTDPYVRIARIRLLPRVFDGEAFCCLPYACQRLDHAFPVLCPARVVLTRVPFGPNPSLHPLRHRSPGFVRRLHRYYDRV